MTASQTRVGAQVVALAMLLAGACGDDQTADLPPCEVAATAAVPEHYAEAEDGQRLVIFGGTGDGPDQGFRLYWGAPTRMVRRVITEVLRFRDGGSRQFHFVVDGRSAMVFFNIRGDTTLELDGRNQVLRLAEKGALAEGLSFFCPSP
jgi:hypothetical protein